MHRPTAPLAAATAAVGRHNISNIVLKIDGNKASGRAYWFHCSNDNPKRAGVFDVSAITKTNW